jgi:hypothetical protein
MISKSATRPVLLLGFILLVILPRWLFFEDWEGNFDADEALVGLAASEVLAGRFPVFLPGQCYMGVLQSAVAAPIIALFGQHANAVRLSPLLWLLPGFFALVYLDRLGKEPITTGRGSWLLAFQWFFPPAVLFLAGAKARGGNLESLVIGLLAVALLWPRRDQTSRAHNSLRAAAAGILFGLGCWTHDQTLLLGPLMGVLLVSWKRGLLVRVAVFLLGCIIGYVPLWLPHLAPLAVGPPGMFRTPWKPEIPPDLWLTFSRHLPAVLVAPLTAGGTPTGAARGVAIALQVLTLGCVAGAIALHLRRRWRWVNSSPAFTATLWLALASTGALLACPTCLGDSQWFRYTLGVAPFLLVTRAWVLSRVNRVLAWSATGVLVVLTLISYQHATACWDVIHGRSRHALAIHLEERGIRHIITTWGLGYFIRFVTEDRILASCDTPRRFPAVETSVELAEEAWFIDYIREPRLFPAAADSFSALEAEFQFRKRRRVPPESLTTALDSLDPHRTLYAHYEPFPLVRPGAWDRDWRGWPYQRPLMMFDAIVWQPRAYGVQLLDEETVEAALDHLVATREFYIAAEWNENRIYLRTP